MEVVEATTEERTPMTNRNVELMQLVGKALESEHGDVLRELLSDVIRQALDADVNALCNAEYGERSVDRSNSRNGYRSRPLETRLGSIDVEIPRVRKGSYYPNWLLQPRRRWEQAFVNVVSEAYVQGVSTRKVEALVESMDARGMSKSEVSPTDSVHEPARATEQGAPTPGARRRDFPHAAFGPAPGRDAVGGAG
jgi:putative transposase